MKENFIRIMDQFGNYIDLTNNQIEDVSYDLQCIIDGQIDNDTINVVKDTEFYCYECKTIQNKNEAKKRHMCKSCYDNTVFHCSNCHDEKDLTYSTEYIYNGLSVCVDCLTELSRKDRTA